MKNKIAFLFGLFLIGCQQAPQGTFTQIQENCDATTLFELLKEDKTGIDFNNKMIDDNNLNYWTHDGVYQGAGVAVGDLNNDGLADIYFAGNKVPDKLYLNKGGMQFEDITESAGITGDNTWSAGVSIADVNNDGFLDIYVCKFLLDDATARQNLLFINNGNSGSPTFKESAAEYGLNDDGYSISGNFFDYDMDGDLDLYVANQPPNSTVYKNEFKQTHNRDKKYTDRLYQNQGNGSFKDVTREAGVEIYSYSLSATMGDFNKDGFPDIYVACDYDEPDYFFKNNGNGTFTNEAHKAMRHISNFSMGTDVADINNDGWLDIYTVDMVANDNFRQKTNMSGMNPEKFWALADNGFHLQYMYNALQLNNGNGTYSEIAQMSGVSSTDWSWSPLFADFDNDGFKDLIVTNGLLKDMRNKDYISSVSKFTSLDKPESAENSEQLLSLLDKAPSEKISNFVYKNNGDLTFSDKRVDWGFDEKGFSHGAAYADFDLDGDLDLVINNMNATASIFKNTTSNCSKNNFLRIEFTGTGNIDAIGTNVKLELGEEVQYQELSPVRGYMSSSENSLHFGLGSHTSIDKMTVTWPDGSISERVDVPTGQILRLSQAEAVPSTETDTDLVTMFRDNTIQSGVRVRHTENDYNDYKQEVLLPYRMSRLGPCIATGDINGDGLEDFYAGGASGQAGFVNIQQAGGTFKTSSLPIFEADKNYEDIGALLFDADGDSDMDLYVVSGGNEFYAQTNNYQDRLYINDGRGAFSKSSALPKILESGSVAAAGDYDKDGDLDLFVGGRQVPGKYGSTPKSFLLQNNGGKFSVVTSSVAPELDSPGMVTDAIWLDYDNDSDEDLIVVGEWMAISIYENNNGKLQRKEFAGLENTNGWWNRIVAEDIDGDGDQDFVVGNLGLNIKYKALPDKPFKLYSKDFDNSGTNDVYLGYYDTDGVCYPVRGRQCSSEEMPFIKKKYKTYTEFASADIEEVLEGKTEGANYREAHTFETVWIENVNGQDFKIRKLPTTAQIAPVFGIVTHDWNKDGNIDLMFTGNFHEREVETTRSDAGTGQIFYGDGQGNFDMMNTNETGIMAILDARAMKKVVDSAGNPIILIANNNNVLQVYKENPTYQNPL